MPHASTLNTQDGGRVPFCEVCGEILPDAMRFWWRLKVTGQAGKTTSTATTQLTVPRQLAPTREWRVIGGTAQVMQSNRYGYPRRNIAVPGDKRKSVSLCVEGQVKSILGSLFHDRLSRG